jgi:hypothetical protein
MKKISLAFVCALSAFMSSVIPAHAQSISKSTIAIGDSVMLGAKKALNLVGITRVDAVVGRQSQDAGSLLNSISSSLPTNIVLNLGANGPFTLYHCRQILDAVGKQRHVFLLTVKVPRAWETQSNTAIHECANNYPNRVTLVDWNARAKNHGSWFGKDGLHLDAAGALAYASLIEKALKTHV